MGTVIFDFDGTIADSLHLFIDVMHELANRKERIPAVDLERMRGMTVREIARVTNFPLWKLPFISRRGFSLMRSRIAEVKECKGMPEAIKAIKAQGHVMYIMSSNSVQNIELFLEKHKLRNEFGPIYGDVGVFGKKRMLKKVLRQNKLNKDEVLYIGDEVRDIEGAKHAGVRVISVTWGYNNAEILAKHHPDAIVNVAEELPGAVAQLLESKS